MKRGAGFIGTSGTVIIERVVVLDREPLDLTVNVLADEVAERVGHGEGVRAGAVVEVRARGGGAGGQVAEDGGAQGKGVEPVDAVGADTGPQEPQVPVVAIGNVGDPEMSGVLGGFVVLAQLTEQGVVLAEDIGWVLRAALHASEREERLEERYVGDGGALEHGAGLFRSLPGGQGQYEAPPVASGKCWCWPVALLLTSAARVLQRRPQPPYQSVHLGRAPVAPLGDRRVQPGEVPVPVRGVGLDAYALGEGRGRT